MSEAVAAIPRLGRPGVAPSFSRVRSSVVSLLVAAFVLKAVLDAAYLILMRDLFSTGPTADAGLGRALWSYALTGLAATAVSLDVALRPGPGNIASLLYLCLVAVPMFTLYGFGVQYADTGFVLAIVMCTVLTVAARHALPAIRPPVPGRVVRGLVLSLLAAMACYVYGALVATRGLGRLNFDLALVYEFRDEFSLSEFPLANYVVSWQAYVINMALLAYCAYRQRWIAVALVFAAQVLLFGMTNHKSYLLAPVLVLGVLWLARSPLRVAWGIVAGSALVVLAAWGLFLVTEQILIPSIFVRRLFFVPGELHFWYHDYFSTQGNPYVLLSNSVLTPASPYPYAESVPELIGWAYTGTEIRANAGWMADAYAHFGLPGMAVFAVLLAAFLRVLDGVSTGVPRGLATAVVAVPAMALVNSGLLTVLLTHGFGLAVVLLWLMNDRPGQRA